MHEYRAQYTFVFVGIAILLVTLTFLRTSRGQISLPHLPHNSENQISIVHTSNTTEDTNGNASFPQAVALSAKALMARPLATDLTKVPKIFHQFWSEPELPAKFDAWTANCRAKNPDWEWVLWNVNDSLELVEDFVPWFLPTYHKLDEENVVYRADILRNMFMHIFGGVYADLDTDCLQGWDSLIKEYREPGYRQVYTARMGTNDAHSNSIPNAWMASTPGHPFWLLPLEYLEKHMGGDQQPEAITGPGALKACIDDEYLKKYRWDDKALDLHYAASGWRSLFQIDPALQNSSEDTQKTTVQTSAQTLTILPQWEVFPYAWTEDGISVRPWCSTQKETFNATRCKELLAVEAWGSHAISYFSHSWGGESDMDKVGMTEEEKEAEKKTKEGVEKEDERSKKMGVSFKDASGRASQEKNDVLTATAASTSGSSLTSASIPTAMLPTPGFDYEEDD
ncbi:hypothetical protein MMC21_006754 [Puttea exsequens]|nr:hypothetical protein [Puttea exsequens]